MFVLFLGPDAVKGEVFEKRKYDLFIYPLLTSIICRIFR